MIPVVQIESNTNDNNQNTNVEDNPNDDSDLLPPPDDDSLPPPDSNKETNTNEAKEEEKEEVKEEKPEAEKTPNEKLEDILEEYGDAYRHMKKMMTVGVPSYGVLQKAQMNNLDMEVVNQIIDLYKQINRTYN